MNSNPFEPHEPEEQQPQSGIESSDHPVSAEPMQAHASFQPPFMQTPDPQPPSNERFWNLPLIVLSWLIIVFICGVMFALVQVSYSIQEERKVSKFDLMQTNTTTRYTVGNLELFEISEDQQGTMLASDGGQLLEQRFCKAILINEVKGVEAAREYMADLESLVEEIEFELDEDQQQLFNLLDSLFADYADFAWDAPSLDENERVYLKDKLGWSGELALLPESGPDQPARELLLDQAKLTSIKILVAAVSVILMGGFGVLSGMFLLVLLLAKKLNLHFVSQKKHGGVYLETFALFLLSFLALQFIAGIFGLPAALVPFAMLSLVAVIVWPVIRGVSVSDMLDDVGLRVKNPFKEIFAGLVGYLAATPFLAMAIIFVGIVMLISTQMEGGNELSPPTGPSHPIQEEIAESNSVMPILGILFTACVVAPILEEIMFRGLLYRYLREFSHRWAFWGSVAFSCIVNALLFAMIHPQGLLGIPMLATLAVSFSLAREWRDSLIAPMVMHAINNFLVTGMLLIML